jgi:NAD(P)-dependent dehydrogenase (short-subunit alcohol dehydrogenase family)
MYQARFRLENEVAVITGGGRGIGLACAEALAEAGARLVLVERDEAVGAEGMAALAGKGYEAELLIGNVTDSDRMTDIAALLATRGTPATILVNNAGIGETGVPTEEVTDEAWQRTMDVNVNGVFFCARAFGRPMLRQGRGSIVNIGSMSGTIVNRPQPQAAYNVSKAAVHHLTRCLAVEWAQRGVRVNAVAPTYIETPMVTSNPRAQALLDGWLRDTPMARMGQVDEVASAVLFLASDAASLVTGAIVPVDGGYVCW